MVTSFFTPEHVEKMKPFIKSTVDETLQSLAAKGGKQPVDLVETFSLPIPSTVGLDAPSGPLQILTGSRLSIKSSEFLLRTWAA